MGGMIIPRFEILLERIGFNISVFLSHLVGHFGGGGDDRYHTAHWNRAVGLSGFLLWDPLAVQVGTSLSM